MTGPPPPENEDEDAAAAEAAPAATAAEASSESSDEPAMSIEPPPAPAPDEPASSPEPEESQQETPVGTDLAPEAGAAPVALAEMQPPPPPPPPPAPPPSSFAAPVAPAAKQRSSGASIAAGIVLVVVGIFFLTIRLLSIDLSTSGWPLYVIIPGLTLLVVGFASLRTGAAIPGGIVTMAGLVLAYQSATGDWASWAFAWALVAPGGVGLGMFLQGLRLRNPSLTRQGRSTMFVGFVIFMIGFIFFESILNISGYDYGYFGKAALPALLILVGLAVLARNIRRRSST